MSKEQKVKPDLAAAPEFPVRPLNFTHIKDGIIVRVPNWLGDAVMTLPAIMQLKKILPEFCALFVLCPKGLKDMFESLTCVNMVITLEKTHRNWSRGDIRRLTRIHPGAAVLFNNSLRDAVFMRMCGIKHLYGAAARGRAVLFKRSFKFPARVSYNLNNLHHTNKYLSIVKALGADDWDGSLPEFEIITPLDQTGNGVSDLCEHPALLTIAGGAAYGGSKRWPADSFRKVAEWWVHNGGIVAVLGSAAEETIAAEISDGLPASKVFNLAGKTDMCELMHLLRNSKFCIANDSGIMHLSAALGGHGLAIFGPTDWTATGPISERWKIVYEKQECSPCFKRECPTGSCKCMKNIMVERVIAEIKKMIA
ncbi:lipopolysaccharide heptosyltransferase II [Lentisphaerota bacterium ZTH]|nr:lipopolysaccharide heptosyltransferase II [Lentisphaerota bacterium]WET07055.1 lipopolysaccharide heptosyltransferase II [Lentisphaerota bacterium ZTH]